MGTDREARAPASEGPDLGKWQMSDRQEDLLREWGLADKEKPQEQGSHVLMFVYGRAVCAWLFYWFLIVPISSAYSNVRSVLNQTLQPGPDKAVESVNYVERVQEAVGHLGVDRTWALVFLAVVPILGYVVLRTIIASVRWIAQGSSRSEAIEPTRPTSAKSSLAEDAPTTLPCSWRPSGASWKLYPAGSESRPMTSGEWGMMAQSGRDAR